jgi:hypothetical protein
VAVSPAPKKPRRRKPARAPAVGDLALDLRSIVASGGEAMRDRMAELRAAPPSPETTSEILTIAKETAVIMGGVRRLDDSIRAASKKLSPAAVIDYLRNLQPEERDEIIGEAGGKAEPGSVFGRG